MAYYLNLYSPATYEAFSKTDRTVTGFQERHQAVAKRITPGDTLLCYMIKLSRWIGAQTLVDGPFIDHSPIFSENDPYIVRFHITPDIWLPVEKSIPIKEDELWNGLSFTKGYDKGDPAWAQAIKGSLRVLSDSDAVILMAILQRQASGGSTYPVDPEAYQRLLPHVVRRADKDVSVTIPPAAEEAPPSPPQVASELTWWLQALRWSAVSPFRLFNRHNCLKWPESWIHERSISGVKERWSPPEPSGLGAMRSAQ